MKELSFKFLAIKNLIKRNKARTEDQKAIKDNSSVNATSIEVVKDNPTFSTKNEEVIKFPFIVLVSSTPENSVRNLLRYKLN